MADNPSPQEATLSSQSILAKLNKLSVFKQFGLIIAASLGCALGVLLVLNAQSDNYRPLNITLSANDLAQAGVILDKSKVSFKIDPATSNLLIKEQDFSRARLALAGANLGSDDVQNGFELLDEKTGLGVSSFIENANYLRGLEGELARTITSINKIKNARVHLAIPKTAVFVRDARSASASVLVELHAGQMLNEAQVNAIVNLVATSVSNLKPADVSVVDQQGRLLSINDPNDASAEALKQLDYQKQLENMLLVRADNILRPVLGDGHYAIQLTAEIDFSLKEITAETYQKEPILRSEQSSKENLKQQNSASGIPGALSNQPLPQATAPEKINNENIATNNDERDMREKITKNYEVGRSINHTKADVATLKRLSFALIVDAPNDAANKDELINLGKAVQHALGFNEVRGDSFTLVSRPFATRAEPQIYIEPWYLNAKVLNLVKIILIGIFLLISVFFVVRVIKQALTVPKLEPISNSAQDDNPVSALDVNANYVDKLSALQKLAGDDAPRFAAALKEWLKG